MCQFWACLPLVGLQAEGHTMHRQLPPPLNPTLRTTAPLQTAKLDDGAMTFAKLPANICDVCN